MNVLLFMNHARGTTGGRLLKAVQNVVPGHHLEVLRNYRKLMTRLNKVPKNLTVVVLAAQSRDQLLELVALGPCLDGIRIILIVPDDKKSTIALGHLLRPSLLTSGNAITNFTDVAAVLSKCLG